VSRTSKRPSPGEGAGVLGWIVRFTIRRARLIVAIWIVLVGLLAVKGQNLDQELTIHSLTIGGTQSARAHEIAVQEFSSGDDIIVMLRGPASEVERQGKGLERRLDALPHTQVVSPWARGGAFDRLRPSPGVAAMIVRVEGIVGDTYAPVKRMVDENVASPVRASVAGFPGLVESVRKAGFDAGKLGELIATPVLLIILLLVFRSVFAAAMPVVIGGAVVAAGRGLLSVAHEFVQVDLFAAAMMGMMGLALGVDYSLLVVARFREERGDGDIPEVVGRTVTAAARSILPAGCGLILAMAASGLVLPSDIASSASITVIIVAALSMVSAICVVPALLTLIGPNLDRWSLPQKQGSGMAPLRLSRRIARQPRAVFAIFAALLVFASLAFTLNTNIASIAFLPPGDPGRQQQEEVQEALGPGWIAPMEVVMDGRGTPVTSTERLRALASFQRRLERDPRVAAVVGFSAIEHATRQLSGIEGKLAKQERGLDKLESGLSRIHDGAKVGSSGLRQAAEGSAALDSGIGLAGAGAGALAGGLEKTSTGSGRLTQGLSRAGEGTGQLSQGTEKASNGADKIAAGLEKAASQTGEVVGSARLFKNAMHSGDDRLEELHAPLGRTEEQLAAAWEALRRMSAGQEDPEYAAALAAVEAAHRDLTGADFGAEEPAGSSSSGVRTSIERAEGQFDVGLYLAAKLDKSGHQAQTGIGKLARASGQLDDGLGRLAVGSRRLADGIGALAQGGEVLSPALLKLSEGARRLAGGLGQLGSGSTQLAGGLGTGAEKSELLSGALERVNSGLRRGREGPDASGLDQLRKRSPGMFHSPYFTLAGLDGSRAEQRTQLASLVNLDHGGSDARMLVIPRDPPNSSEVGETKERLERDGEALARETGTEVVVGGVPAAAIDANQAFRDQAIPMRILLSLVSLIVLIPVVRSLMLPIIAALINLLTVSASFGVLSLLFNDSLLGGPGYVDTAVLPSAMIVIFGLAIDYEVFVFARIREEYLRTGSTRAAIENGLDRTAHVVTGAATIMIAVFLAFSVSEFITVRNFGIAQAIAIFIDAFIVRLVVIPAVMGRLGKWCWWMPAWLDRLLPGGRLPATKTEAAPS
jgi:RND superfamily putative drug exporter